MKTDVLGFSPGQKPYGSDQSSTGSVRKTSKPPALKRSDVQTISLASQATHSPKSASGSDAGKMSATPITPTPFSGAVGHTPYGPAPAMSTYVTAGSARSIVRAEVVGSAMIVIVGVLTLQAAWLRGFP